MTYALIDFETKSAANLKKTGAWVYSECPTTEILCLAYSIDGAEAKVWAPRMGIVCPDDLAFVIETGGRITAHNVLFERAIWRNIMVPLYGWPPVDTGQWFDTMAVCAMKSLPQKLEMASKALGLNTQKDMDGNRLTLAQSRVNKAGSMATSLDAQTRIEEYCKTDIRGELELAARVGAMPEREYKVWQLDQRINERGVALDLNYITQAEKIVADASGPLIKEFRQLTGNLNPTQRDKVMQWMDAEGVKLPNFQKATVAALLGAEEGDDTEIAPEIAEEVASIVLPLHVRRALEIRQVVGSASIKKLPAMRACLASDGRAHGVLQYHGAGTGRWAGRLLQPQNFPRGTIKNKNDQLVDAILTGDYEYVEMLFGGSAVEAVISGIRHAVTAAPGHLLVAGDYSAIEARVVLAIAGNVDKVAVLAAGHNIYEDMASNNIYHRPITKEENLAEYTIGKAAVLGLGFQMGWKTFQEKSAPEASDDFCKLVVDTYRREFAPEVPALWKGLEEAALNTVTLRRPHEAYGVLYALEDGWMTARLPSGRKLWYFDPRPCRKGMPWDADDVRPAWSYRAFKYGQMRTVDAYGGLLTENVVQALARDLLVSAMMKCEKNNMPLVLTVHDEIVLELPEDRADLTALEQIMADRPRWAIEMNIPVKAEGWVSDRYRK